MAACALGIDTKALETSDIHVHVPSGAIPKDGPSAGVAMYTALVSLLTGRLVRNDVAMTGEISLRGLVLPVGGIREKVLAALAAGITRVILPARNQHEWEEVPAKARAVLVPVWVERVDEVLQQALSEPVSVARSAAVFTSGEQATLWRREGPARGSFLDPGPRAGILGPGGRLGNRRNPAESTHLDV